MVKNELNKAKVLSFHMALFLKDSFGNCSTSHLYFGVLVQIYVKPFSGLWDSVVKYLSVQCRSKMQKTYEPHIFLSGAISGKTGKRCSKIRCLESAVRTWTVPVQCFYISCYIYVEFHFRFSKILNIMAQLMCAKNVACFKYFFR